MQTLSVPREQQWLVRRVLIRAQRWICPICGKAMKYWGSNLDHVIPRSRGGPDRLGNLLAAHSKCNTSKSNNLPTGCELVMLIAVNSRLGIQPDRM